MDKYCSVVHTEDGKVMGLIYPEVFSTTQGFLELLQFLELKAPYFARNDLQLLVPIDLQMAFLLTHDTNISRLVELYPFLKLMIRESFPNLIDGRKNRLLENLCERYEVWLGNLGSGARTNMVAVMEGMFDGVVLDAGFAEANATMPFFPSVIREVGKYTKYVVVPGVSTGKYREVRLRHVESLI